MARTVIAAFRRQAQGCTEHCQLKSLLGEVSREIGFDYFALVVAVRMQRHNPLIHHFSEYPEDWIQGYILPGGFVDDPILQASSTRPVVFCGARSATIWR